MNHYHTEGILPLFRLLLNPYGAHHIGVVLPHKNVRIYQCTCQEGTQLYCEFVWELKVLYQFPEFLWS